MTCASAPKKTSLQASEQHVLSLSSLPVPTGLAGRPHREGLGRSPSSLPELFSILGQVKGSLLTSVSPAVQWEEKL